MRKCFSIATILLLLSAGLSYGMRDLNKKEKEFIEKYITKMKDALKAVKNNENATIILEKSEKKETCQYYLLKKNCETEISKTIIFDQDNYSFFDNIEKMISLSYIWATEKQKTKCAHWRNLSEKIRFAAEENE